ncbi:MAG: biotin carboxylase N-terminal domain-containing protein [Sneathiella sp.]
MKKIKTLLIANRGEIAHRIIRTAKALGLETVAVYTEPDAGTPHTKAADQAIFLPEVAGRGEPYLDSERLIEVALRSGADTIHPGYGFLSENADFAEACVKAGLVFVGPGPDAIRLMADKAAGKASMARAGVRCVPGYDGEDQSLARLKQEAEKINTPLLIKAVAGGGGRGMRRIDNLAQFDEALASAKNEARNAFGSEDVILERYLTETRHIEIQIFADQHGNAVHLFERDCSTQRRHQKVIEEAPSPIVDADLRGALGQAAVKAATAIGYVGAGTVEFLVTPSWEFFFIEMNTRLQVEHPVTEEITGLDLVEWQLQVADGEMLPASQADIQMNGASIEVRLYAENPSDGFMPQTGAVSQWEPPVGDGVRVDHMIVTGNEISARYDPMIGKLIVHEKSREGARKKLIKALLDLKLSGILTNRAFLLKCLAHDSFIGGPDTGFVDRLLAEEASDPAGKTNMLVAAVLYWLECRKWRAMPSDWSSLGNAFRTITLVFGEKEISFEIRANEKVAWVKTDDHPDGVRITLETEQAEITRATIEDQSWPVSVWENGGETYLDFGSDFAVAHLKDPNPANQAGGSADHFVKAPMAGRILSVEIKAGEAITAGQTLVILEAMKMEHRIRAGQDGQAEAISVSVGDQVGKNDLLVSLAS